ncbi:GNAT family N-acetyltransferase [Sporanaerobium hydrogeniformans]|uniref:GNAT family N-acetyltransferase n=1 Tax=Sporanaerobium hydrogeniformans TaxID=3072179 RepID=UPI0027E4712F|nr:GNAT family N-acetyltransferase [Sporanaerobium hydrogeniformans]
MVEKKQEPFFKKFFLQKGDLLILDEPTNHLDSEGIKWLLRTLRGRSEAILIISHDRYFLDQCVNRVVEIEEGKLKSYEGNYSFYRKEKQKQFEDKLHAYYEQEKIKACIQNQITELKNWSGKAHREAAAKAIKMGNKMGGKQYNRAKAKRMDQQVKSRIKRLEKINREGLQKPKEESTVYFEIQKASKTGAVLLEAKDIGKSYGAKCLFEKSSFYIKRGEKIGLYGPNGCGKSTLIKALLKEIDIEGRLYYNLHTRIGYISQEVIDLDERKTVLDLFKMPTRQEQSKLRSELCQLGFKREDLMKKIGSLSLGERMKLKLLLMIHEGCEMLILDEPTNHIDLHVRERLEEALKAYQGTILLVTHDRYMLEAVCDKMLIFENKQIKRYEYNLIGYEEKQEELKKLRIGVLKKRAKQRQEELLRQENRLAYVIGALAQVNKEILTYKILEKEYEELMILKRQQTEPYYYRLVDTEDQGFLEDILYEAIFVEEGEQVPRDIVYKPEVYKYVADWGQKGDLGYALVDKNTHQGIGAVWIRFFDYNNKGYAYIRDDIPELGVAILPPYRGRGLGTKLIAYFLKKLPLEVSSVSLSVDNRNPAKRLYERLGFKSYSQDMHHTIMLYSREP